MPESIAITGAAQQAAWGRRVLPPVEQVRPGLWSIPVPIPGSPLRYTLSYAVVGSGGVVVVDPGWDSAAGRLALTAGLAAAGATPGDVAGVVVTHIHPDHHGLSGWLREGAGAWIAMHPAEAASLPGRVWRHRRPGVDRDWLRGQGAPDGELDALALHSSQLADLLEMAEPDRMLEDGDRVPVVDGDLRAVWTPGHTPGHLCLHDAAAGVLLTGDHLLPRISPNIGVHSEGGGDPLTAYLASLERTAGFAADEALPAHEYRFRGIDTRAAELIGHHQERSAEVLAVVDRLAAPTAWAVAAELTWSHGWAGLHGISRRLALAETVAHLTQLYADGRLSTTPGLPRRWSRSAAVPHVSTVDS